MRSSAVRGALGILLTLGAAVVEAQQPAFRVADLNTSHPSPRFFDPFLDSETVNGLFYFVEDDGIHGYELWVSNGSTAGTRLVADVCPGECSSYPYYLLASPEWGLLFFHARDGANGNELWQTDGTPEGTRIVTSFEGYPNDFIGPFFEHDGYLFFPADDPFYGDELWRWDGTFGPSSILLTMDLTPRPHFSSGTRVLAASGDKLLVSAYNGEPSLSLGVEPWVLSGPSYRDSQVLLGDLNPGQGSSVYFGFDRPNDNAIAAPWGGFVFLADDGSHGLEVWKTDGTPGGTSLLKDVSAGVPSSSPHGLTAIGGAVYFVATDPQNGTELWKTDGTTTGTVLVKDVQPGSGGSEPFELTPWGNRLFFHADDGVHGIELWVTDGTTAGTVLVKDVEPGPSGSFGADWLHSGLSLLGDRLLFFAPDPAGARLWRSDGTSVGTVPVNPPSPSSAWPYSASLFSENTFGVAGGSLYFRGVIPGDEIWRTDGTATGTVLIKDVDETTSAFFMAEGLISDSFGALGGNVFFQATDGSSGVELWRSNGTEAGTELVTDLRPGSSSSLPHQLRSVGSRLIFSAFSGPEGVWSTDGTSGGTQSLVLDDLPWEIGVGGGNAFFAAGSSDNGGKLWRTDGTPAGTVPLIPLFPGSDSSPTREYVEVGSKVFFPFTDSAGTELWASDGTAPGTYRVANIAPELPPGSSPQNSYPSNLTRVGNLLFFSASTNAGTELWKSDGTTAGTVLVKDINPGSLIPFFSETNIFAAAGGLLLFVADDGQSGLELWRSDGTEAGTVIVKDIHSGPSHSYPQQLTSVGDRVYFTAEDALHGRELWVSDGTGAGTHLVEDILPGTGSSRPRNLTALPAVDGRALLFSAFDSLGVESWRSSGTPLGTRRLADIAPGALSSSPARFMAAGANVYFVANDNVTGFELWALPKASVLATFEDVPTTYWAWPYVEALADASLTNGCGEGLYCPARPVTRAEMAVFVLRAIHGASYVPPDVPATRFDDVPVSHWAVDWIEQLAAESITSGCGQSPPLFCPESPTARDQMAVFLLRALHGAGYTPPPATGTVFTDVPASYWAAAWIEQLAAEGITTGCAANLYCPGDPVSRDQMAVFLTRALDLPLP